MSERSLGEWAAYQQDWQRGHWGTRLRLLALLAGLAVVLLVSFPLLACHDIREWSYGDGNCPGNAAD